jgi:hypothetical protein
LPKHVVVLRVTFDEQGDVADIGSSPIGDPTASAHLPHFDSAVRETVRTWRCRPARIRKFRPGPDSDGDGKPDYAILSGQRVLKTYFDISFSFELIDGVPVVEVQ